MSVTKEEKVKIEAEVQKSQFFITDLLNLATEGASSKRTSPRLLNQSTNLHPLDISNTQLNEASTMQQSLLDTSIQNHLKQSKTASHKRYQSVNNSFSRYHNIPTENVKFEKFIDLLYTSKMSQEEVKSEIKSFVKVLETNYNDTIRELKVTIDKIQKKLRKVQSSQVTTTVEKSEMETLFVDCVEDVRKEVMKRRLKNEIVQKKKGLVSLSKLGDKTDEEAREFEESLLKLAALAKNKIKYSDFTAKDRYNILDLFVNNEKTLIKVYEALFPHRVTANGFHT
jgi:hypothetical protein